MAGSGKTTLLQRLSSHLHTTHTPGYIINLDPAVTQVPYGANIDIRDTVHKLVQRMTSTICFAEPSSPEMLVCPGELQERDETVWPGSQRRNSDIPQSFCNQVRSGTSSSYVHMTTSIGAAHLRSILRLSCTQCMMMVLSLMLTISWSCSADHNEVRGLHYV